MGHGFVGAPSKTTYRAHRVLLDEAGPAAVAGSDLALIAAGATLLAAAGLAGARASTAPWH
jgi:hypothetical protein